MKMQKHNLSNANIYKVVGSLLFHWIFLSSLFFLLPALLARNLISEFAAACYCKNRIGCNKAILFLHQYIFLLRLISQGVNNRKKTLHTEWTIRLPRKKKSVWISIKGRSTAGTVCTSEPEKHRICWIPFSAARKDWNWNVWWQILADLKVQRRISLFNRAKVFALDKRKKEQEKNSLLERFTFES